MLKFKIWIQKKNLTKFVVCVKNLTVDFLVNNIT